jgi:glycosyltransferase involved in cell wall biosynthesis
LIDISVVMITRNQEWNVARLIESVIQGTIHIDTCQIMLVDSASIDRTPDIACLYPINVVRLQENQPLSAAAGRYVGYLHTSGRFILFLDGDMALSSGWIQQALTILGQRPNIACITGKIIDRPLESIDRPAIEYENKVVTGNLQEISSCGGASLYRRIILDQVGPFNPYLISDEEPELCFRIRHAGYKIMRLGIPIAYHYTAPHDKISTVFGRRQRGLYCGAGQNLRYYLGTPLFWNYLSEKRYICSTAFATLIGAISLVLSIATHKWLWIGIGTMVLVGFISVETLRKKSFYSTMYSFIKRLIVLEAIFHGFFMHPYSPHSYPARVDLLKTN